MTSPVDTSVKFITSDMAGSPVLTDSGAGSFTGLLDAFLVDGWGLQTATSLVVSNGVATLTFGSTFPAVVDSVILVAGSTPGALNGEQKVTAVGANTVSFATAEANGTATGTITVKMAPAGWSKPFSKTNVGVYRSTDPHSHGMYLRVDDTSTTGNIRVRGFENMTTVDVGTGPFPTNAQVSGGLWWQRADSSGTSPAPYAMFADSRMLIAVFCPHGTASPTTAQTVCYAFGDPTPVRPSGDVYSTILIGGNSSTDYSRQLDCGGDVNAYCPRAFTGIGGPVAQAVVPFVGSPTSVSGADSFMGSFPSPIDGKLVLSKRRLSDGTLQSGVTRAIFPGALHVPQTVPSFTFGRFSVTDAAGELVGRRLMALWPGSSGNDVSTHRVSFVDITGPWR